ncbi:uncharacterized protein [Sinocyclocheilus grahami]|uniref:uncharacterized protein n=1 Tax=Sinocyclocheilus grahami TaxID=75366 RepID=UPI0007AC6375|nr:PREDICTED: uncharacterized protein LOC107574738 [Sinocyclocheilus grahami]
MKILLIFLTFYLISGESFSLSSLHVTGYSGASLLVDSGKLWFRANVKCMNKLPEWTNIMNNTKHDKWISVGKFTLFQNNEGNLTIYIRDLKEHDAGGYWIGVLYKWGIDMTLHVEEDLYCKVSKRVMVNTGETANFSCEYSQNHINKVKIIFKEEKDSIETIYSRWKKKERFSISDDKHKHIFSVRITAVTPDDGGVYLCGVWINRDSYSYSIINTVHLHIMNFSMIIIISVCVILLLIGGFTLTVCKLRHKRRDPGSVQSHDELPTIPSDGLLYAAVSFQRHEESLSDATVRLSNEEIHSDYTTVIYHTRLN